MFLGNDPQLPKLIASSSEPAKDTLLLDGGKAGTSGQVQDQCNTGVDLVYVLSTRATAPGNRKGQGIK
jgi:hypothetical protein